MKFNKAQRKHAAATLNALGLGQLAFFGYHSAQELRLAVLAASFTLFVVLETAALAMLKGEE